MGREHRVSKGERVDLWTAGREHRVSKGRVWTYMGSWFPYITYILYFSYVIEPYHQYPNLLDILFTYLKTEHAVEVRREVIRVLGLLGALDPYKHTQHQLRNEKRSKMGTPISKPMDKKTQGTGECGVE